eukprot:6210255-Pleurochrysis_carterae.AAC.1
MRMRAYMQWRNHAQVQRTEHAHSETRVRARMGRARAGACALASTLESTMQSRHRDISTLAVAPSFALGDCQLVKRRLQDKAHTRVALALLQK